MEESEGFEETTGVSTEVSSFSTREEAVESEAASSIVKLEISPPSDEFSSSPLMDGAGDVSGVVVLQPLDGEGEGDNSPSSTC